MGELGPGLTPEVSVEPFLVPRWALTAHQVCEGVLTAQDMGPDAGGTPLKRAAYPCVPSGTWYGGVMETLRVTAGLIEYGDTGGDGPVLVLLHGVNMDGTVWAPVQERLPSNYRCITPTLPLGSHRRAMERPDLVSHRGVSAMVGELLEALDLHDVTLVLNDWGGAQFLLADGPNNRIAAAVLVACEAFDNFPPGRPGKMIATSARVPAFLWLAMQMQRFRWFRRAPGGWGWMIKRPVPKEVMDGWFRPAQHNAGVRRDLRQFALSTP